MSEESETNLYLSSKFEHLHTNYPSTDRSTKTLSQLNQTTAIIKKSETTGPRLKIKLSHPSSIHPKAKPSFNQKYVSQEEEMIMSLIGMRSGRNLFRYQPNVSTKSILKPSRSPSPCQSKRVSFRDKIPEFDDSFLGSGHNTLQIGSSSGRKNKYKSLDFRKRKVTQLKRAKK